MKLYDVDGYDRPLMLSPEHAAELGATEHVPVEIPATTAAKADWVAYAVDQGADPGEAEASTKAELIETYGG